MRLLAVPQDPHPLLAPSATICATFGGTGEGEDVAGASTGWQGRGGGSAGPPQPLVPGVGAPGGVEMLVLGSLVASLLLSTVWGAGAGAVEMKRGAWE